MKKLAGRTCVITGAGSGIGRALALSLADKGCHLALSDINESGLEQSVRLVSDRGARVSGHLVDVAQRAEMERFVEAVLSVHHGVNVVVNNAGVSVAAKFIEHSLEDFEWLMGINFWGVVYGCKLFLPHLLKEEEAHIVNLSSVFGLTGVPMQSSYCASKFAVRGFSESLRIELADTQVGVTTVHPGGIATNIAASSRFPAGPQAEEMRKRTVKAFAKMLPPEAAARRIVRGIEHNKARVLITREAYAIDAAKRLAPNLSTAATAWGFARMQKREAARKA